MPTSKYDSSNWENEYPSYIPDPYIPVDKKPQFSVEVNAYPKNSKYPSVQFTIIRYVEGVPFHSAFIMDPQALGIEPGRIRDAINTLNMMFKSGCQEMQAFIRKTLNGG